MDHALKQKLGNISDVIYYQQETPPKKGIEKKYINLCKKKYILIKVSSLVMYILLFVLHYICIVEKLLLSFWNTLDGLLCFNKICSAFLYFVFYDKRKHGFV